MNVSLDSCHSAPFRLALLGMDATANSARVVSAGFIDLAGTGWPGASALRSLGGRLRRTFGIVAQAYSQSADFRSALTGK